MRNKKSVVALTVLFTLIFMFVIKVNVIVNAYLIEVIHFQDRCESLTEWSGNNIDYASLNSDCREGSYSIQLYVTGELDIIERNVTCTTLPNNFSMKIWMKMYSPSGVIGRKTEVLMEKTIHWGIVLEERGSQFAWGIRYGTSIYYASPENVDTNWHRVELHFEKNGTAELYVDDVLKVSHAVETVQNPTNLRIYPGWYSGVRYDLIQLTSMQEEEPTKPLKTPPLDAYIMLGMGLGGIGLMVLTPWYFIKRFRQKKEVDALCWGTLMFLIGLGFTIGWLWG